ncbi:MAG: carbamoyltransferase HypF [Candidatus Brocadiia bacterium]
MRIRGRVQGVGFRPSIYRAVTSRHCGGFIRNTPEGVLLEIEGPTKTVDDIVDNFRGIIPSRARVDELIVDAVPLRDEGDFVIETSSTNGDCLLPIPPDLTICQKCINEMETPGNRRDHYPFNTCTICGPRFTIARDIPFDRPTSTMDEFPLCDACRTEYENPEDRRFHAQTMSCPDCGPSLNWTSFSKELSFDSTDPLEIARQALTEGHILAVKGLGGFHITCDATREDIVSRLRDRKGRPHKPLAIMVPDLETCRRICTVSPGEEALLTSPSSPIVLMKQKPGNPVAENVAPNLQNLGLMLPYTPLHRLFFNHSEMPPALVMTSCNRSDEPIAIGLCEIEEHLSDIVDGALGNNRQILNRCDDSVYTFHAGGPVPVRRSRGHVPEPIFLPLSGPSIFATGGMLKNTFALTSGNRSFLSQHIGDVSDADNARHFEKTFRTFSSLLNLEPEAIICDLHPDYPTTAFARRIADERDLPLLQVQHHHAHTAATLAEHRITDRVIGVSMDGAGYGTDEAIWGGEFLVADLLSCERAFHISYVPMPGGEQAVWEPDRMALSHLTKAIGPEEATRRMKDFVEPKKCDALLNLLDKAEFSPSTSSCGRLFDAVAALLDVRHTITYEGQAACELEAIADESECSSYDFSWENDQIGPSPVMVAICEDIDKKTNPAIIAARFHNAVSKMIVEGCRRIRSRTGLDHVALSGGVMQNRLLVNRTVPALEAEDFDVLVRRRVPPNDGGICLGQAACALARLDDGQQSGGTEAT